MKYLLFISLILASCTAKDTPVLEQSKLVRFSVAPHELESQVGSFQMPKKLPPIHPTDPNFANRMTASEQDFDRAMFVFQELLPLIQSTEKSEQVAEEIDKQLAEKKLSPNAFFAAKLHLSTYLLIRLLDEQDMANQALIEKNLAFLAQEGNSGNTILAYRAFEQLGGYSKTEFLKELASKFDQNLTKQIQGQAESAANRKVNNQSIESDFANNMEQQNQILQQTRQVYNQKIKTWLDEQKIAN